MDTEQPEQHSEGGLSHAHIGPHDAVGCAGGESAAGAWAVSFWDGGTSVEVKRLSVAKSGAARVVNHCDKAAVSRRNWDKWKRKRGLLEDDEAVKQVGGGKRGVIQTFSRQSRRRLLERVHRLKKDARCLFITLTLPDGVETSGKALKRWLKAWWKRIQRRFAAASSLWRVESKARKSGAQVGAAVGHLHLLMFGVPMQPGLKQFISESWFAVVGSGDEKHLKAGTRVEAPRDWDAVSKYATKLYAAKAGDSDPVIPDVGRFWGFLNESAVPFAEAVVVVFSMREGHRLLRALRSWVRSDRRKRGLSPPARLTQWRSFFVGDATQWLDAAVKL